MSPATEKSSTAAGWYTIGQMRAWEKNPKKHPDSNVADIARSVRRFGFVAPVVVWGSRGQIVAGHGRYLAAQMILRADPGAYLATDAPGPALIPVRVVEFASDAEASAYALADNRLTEANPMEPVDVAAILKEIQDAGGDVEVPGWTEAEIAAMVAPPPTDGEWGAAMDGLPTEDRAPIQTVTFTLHDDQADVVKQAIERAKGMGAFVDTGNENSNGNALARVCEMFLTGPGR